MERSVTLKQALKKGKSKICTADKCSQVSRNTCEKCSLPACKFHMCARVKNKKKLKICDKCNYAEIKEQLEVENQKEKKQALEKLANLNDKNNDAQNEARADESRIRELESRLKQLECENEVKSDAKNEEIRKEQYLKDRNIEMLANLKAAIDNSTKIFTAENEKLAQVKSQISSAQMDVNQLHSKIREGEISIKKLKEAISNSVANERVEEVLCKGCLAKYRGVSVYKSVHQSKSNPDGACAKCLIN